MTTTKAGARPPIRMIDTEADQLANLAIDFEERNPQVSQLLLGEIERATIQTAANIPIDVVTMNASVEFRDDAHDKDYNFQLVYPKEADIAAGRISILTPVGAGLIGLRQGQSILWPDRDGKKRALTIVKVTHPPKAD